MQSGHALLRVPIAMTVGRRVQLARMTTGRTAKAMAGVLGLSLGTYERIEQDQRQPRRGELIAIAHVTGQDLDFFERAPSLDAAEAGTLSPSPEQVKQSFPSDGDALAERIAQGAST